MSNNVFNVGDIVRCIDPGPPSNDLKLNQLYLVTRANYKNRNDEFICCTEADGSRLRSLAVYVSRFELVQEKDTELFQQRVVNYLLDPKRSISRHSVNGLIADLSEHQFFVVTSETAAKEIVEAVLTDPKWALCDDGIKRAREALDLNDPFVDPTGTGYTRREAEEMADWMTASYQGPLTRRLGERLKSAL